MAGDRVGVFSLWHSRMRRNSEGVVDIGNEIEKGSLNTYDSIYLLACVTLAIAFHNGFSVRACMSVHSSRLLP